MNWIYKILDKYLTHKLVLKVLSKRYNFTWTEDDHRKLGSFASSPVGIKLLAHQRVILYGLLQESMNEPDANLAANRLAVARGFAQAVNCITYSMPHDIPELEEPAESDARLWNPVKSQPVVFK